MSLVNPSSGLGKALDFGSGLAMIGAGGAPTNTNTNTNGTSNTTTNQTASGTSATGYGDQGNSVIATLLPLLSQLANNTNLTPYLAQQTQGINNQSNAAQTSLEANLASRGLSRSPAAAAAMTNLGLNRSNQITQLKQNIPLLQNSLQQSNVGTIGSILSMLPRTQTQNQTSNGTQNTTSQSQQQQSSGGGVGGILSGIGSALLHFI